MRLAYFHAYPHQYAGAQRLTHALAQEFLKRGHEALVVVPDEGPFPDRLRLEEIPLHVEPTPRVWHSYGRSLVGRDALRALAVLPTYWVRLSAAFRSRNLDLVHINDHRGMLLAGPAAALAGVPVVWHLHGPYDSRPLTALGRLIARRILVVSERTRSAQRGLPADPVKVRVLHNGLIALDPGQSDDVLEVVVGRRNGRLIVTGARHHPDKGLDVLVRAAALLRSKDADVRVVIAGAPQPGYEEHHAELVDLVERLGLRETVSFAGFVADPLCLWRSADVYVQPSRKEPFGLGVIEAMSVGTPVVTSAVGGMLETVEPEVNGLQVPPDDPEALARQINRVLSDEDFASRLAVGGRARAADFSMERMVDALSAVYDEVRRRPKRRRSPRT